MRRNRFGAGSGGPLLAALLSLLCLVPAGCERKAPQAAPAAGDRPSTLRIGLIPEQNIFRQLQRYDPLAAHLSKVVGARIELTILPRYGNIIANFKSQELDGGFFGSFTYALAHEKIGLEVVARPVAPDNTSTYHGLIFARKDRGIRNARNMRGKRFVFVDKATTAGYLLPLNYFHEHGIADYRAYLKESYFAGTHEDAIRDVLEGKADVGAAKNTVFRRLSDADPRVRDELVILARSPSVPENALALRNDLDPDLSRKLREAILTLPDSPEGRAVLATFGAVRFVPTANRDYEPVYEYARKAHLDLARYDYLND